MFSLPFMKGEMLVAEKRKDSKGRNLLTGESQRKDGTYMYRYTDAFKVRQAIYANTLNELRIKEKQIQKDLDEEIYTNKGRMTVEQLLLFYHSLNSKWKPATASRHTSILKRVQQHKISQMSITDVKQSHIKKFYLELYEEGRKPASILPYHSSLKCAFEIAVDDDWVRKNPCRFRFYDLFKPEKEDRVALTSVQEHNFLEFVRTSKKHNWYYDIFVLMLETGLRLSETCGLCLEDIDLKNRELHVQRQLCPYTRIDGVSRLSIGDLKSDSAERTLYITNKAYESLLRLIKRRNAETTVEPIIDGQSLFLLKSRKGLKLVTHTMISYHLKEIVKDYNNTHNDKLPNITAHVLRHTFCTKMYDKGIDVKTLQYVMGHAKISTTLNIYTHMSKNMAVNNMKQLCDNA